MSKEIKGKKFGRLYLITRRANQFLPTIVIIENTLIMAEALEYFRNELLTYYPDYLLHADFTDGGKLLLLAKPFVDLDLVMQELCDEMVELVNFKQHLDIYLYRFGENELIEISIN